MNTTLNCNTKGKVLFSTGKAHVPFLIKTEDNLYILVNDRGELTGDAFDSDELSKYFPGLSVE